MLAFHRENPFISVCQLHHGRSTHMLGGHTICFTLGKLPADDVMCRELGWMEMTVFINSGDSWRI